MHGGDRVGPDARPRRRRRRVKIAEALYVGLVTDTGKFMYENTGTRAHVMAAELIEAGRRRPRRLPPHLRGRPVREGRAAGARARADRAPRRRPPHDHAPRRARTSPAPAPRRTTPRASSTTCARSRAPPSRRSCATASARADPEQRKVSLRASDDRVDVSAIARAQGGGGHRQAAGFSTTLPWDELVAFLREQVAAQLDALRVVGIVPRGRRDPVRQARGHDLARRRRAGAPARSARARRSATPARSTRSRPACCSCSSAARRACSAS